MSIIFFFQSSCKYDLALGMTTRNTHDVDSGEAWLILLAASIVLFLSEGLRNALSVLLPTLRDQFETHTWMIGIMIALLHGVKDFVGKLQFLKICSFSQMYMSSLRYRT